jgi:vancomycin resistance protein YoaR
MRKLLYISGGVAVALAATVFIAASRHQPAIEPNTFVGPVSVGGLLPAQARERVLHWWDQERHKELKLVMPGGREQYAASAADLGVELDETLLREMRTLNFWETLQVSVFGKTGRRDIQPRFVLKDAPLESLRDFVEERVDGPTPAKVFFRNGTFERQPETPGLTLDEQKLPEAILTALANGSAEMPIAEAPKRVSDEALAAIAEVVSDFSTTFSEGKVARSDNIRLASRLIDGIVLAPGEQFSFNNVVGRRTAQAGFKVAGVYRNGRKEVDLGGGICQVSSTLYNAALLANLKIVKKQNHSMPVPYLPIGRDAAVDYNSIDLIFENSTPKPIALSAHLERGKVTFRILGQKEPGLEVKIVTSGASSWGTGEKIVQDPSLPAGTRKVIDSGSAGHAVNAFRVIYKNGAEVARESLGKSHYRGSPRLVAVGTRPAANAEGGVPVQTSGTDPDSGDVLNGG